MKQMRKGIGIALTTSTVLALGAVAYLDSHSPRVGHSDSKGLLVATGQYLRPAGSQIVFNSRPNDLALSSDGRYAYLKTSAGLVVVDVEAKKAQPPIKVEGGNSFVGLLLTDNDRTLTYSTASDKVVIFDVDGLNVKVRKILTVPGARAGGNPVPCGMTYQDPEHLLVCLNRDNSLARITVSTGEIEKWDTDVAPFSVAFDPRTQHAYVACWSRQAKTGEMQSGSSGTQIPVDARGVGTGGRLNELDLRGGKSIGSASVGHHAGEILLDGNDLYLPCAGSDTLENMSLAGHSRRTIRLYPNDPLGSAPSSLALSADGSKAYITCSGRNVVLAYDLVNRKPLGEIATGWYPCSIRSAGDKLFIACTKGVGELAPEQNPNSHNSWDLTGSLCIVPSNTVLTSAALHSILPARKNVLPVPVPMRPGEPSLIKHVVYVIRENRTYDQVLGDMKEGDGDPKLCTFGEKVTPNAHALARQFGLLDNYYCNGICSADGHSWAVEGNTTPNLERGVSSWPRSYPFGEDALNTSSTGFLWDAVLASGKSFVNFGEFDYASTAHKESYFDCLKEHQAGTSKIQFKQNIGVARVKSFSISGYPGWDLSIPDVLRADIFLRRLKQMESAGKMPELTILYLCCDHTGGPVTARAQVADNDRALGMCVEGITKSRFWKDTAIFVEEDDPQAGWDHIDGHRSPCLVISPYTRGTGRVSDFYNQNSVLRTVEHILGLKSQTYFNSIAPLMTACFHQRADYSPYQSLTNQIPLDETKSTSFGRAFDLSKPDLIDEKQFNRAIWNDSMPGKPYPTQWEGAHGRGLAKRGLESLSSASKDQD